MVRPATNKLPKIQRLTVVVFFTLFQYPPSKGYPLK